MIGGMSHYQSALEAAEAHLLALQANGVRFVNVQAETLAALQGPLPAQADAAAEKQKVESRNSEMEGKDRSRLDGVRQEQSAIRNPQSAIEPRLDRVSPYRPRRQRRHPPQLIVVHSFAHGGKPAAHPLHRYITYEKRRFSTRYTPATCRYTAGCTTSAGPHTGCAWGKPLAQPSHR